MLLRAFTLRLDPETGLYDDTDMREALDGCDVVNVWEHFQSEQNRWAVLVSYRDDGRPPNKAGPGRIRSERVGEGLNPADKQLFEALRRWRAQTGEELGMPVHHLLSNRQLAEIGARRIFQDRIGCDTTICRYRIKV
mgnify:CR=1 FL=1